MGVFRGTQTHPHPSPGASASRSRFAGGEQCSPKPLLRPLEGEGQGLSLFRNLGQLIAGLKTHSRK